MSIQLVFFPLLFSGYFCLDGAFVVSIVFSGCNQSFHRAFLSSFLVVSMHRHYLECFLLFLAHTICLCHFLFLGHTVCLCHFLFLSIIICLRHLWEGRLYASSWVFLFSGLFAGILLWSTWRIVPSVLRRGQPRCVFLLMKFLLYSLFSSIFLVLPK